MAADEVRGYRHNTILLRRFGGSERIYEFSNGEGNPSPFQRLHALDGVDAQRIQTLLQRLRGSPDSTSTARFSPQNQTQPV